mgnify:CR=1 FL=1
MGIVGESGSGKTVLSRTIMRLNLGNNVHTSGRVRFLDKDLLELPMNAMTDIWGQEIAMVFQDPMTSLNPYMRVSDQMAEVPAVDHVIGNQDKHRLLELALGASPSGPGVLGGATTLDATKARHAVDRSWPEPAHAFSPPVDRTVRTRTFLKVQEGCDAFCTFCIIPFARGPGRSLRPSEVIQHVRRVQESGAREVVLTGTAVDTYGSDLSDELAFDQLIEMVLEKTTIERVRLPSLDPLALSPRLRALMVADARLSPHASLAGLMVPARCFDHRPAWKSGAFSSCCTCSRSNRWAS